MSVLIREMIEVFKKSNPSPKIELDYKNHFMLLVAVLLSAQATDKQVNIVTSKLFKSVSTPCEMLGLGEEGLKGYIKSINYFNNKAKNIIATSKILYEKFNNKVPSDRKSLMKLPGIGRKSANVILNVLYGAPTLGVDTHISRVAQRLGLSEEVAPDKIEGDLIKIIPSDYIGRMHQWLVLHGRYTCKSRKPLCSSCPIKYLCNYNNKCI